MIPESLFIIMCAVAAFAIFGQLANAVIAMAEESIPTDTTNGIRPENGA